MNRVLAKDNRRPRRLGIGYAVAPHAQAWELIEYRENRAERAQQAMSQSAYCQAGDFMTRSQGIGACAMPKRRVWTGNLPPRMPVFRSNVSTHNIKAERVLAERAKFWLCHVADDVEAQP